MMYPTSFFSADISLNINIPVHCAITNNSFVPIGKKKENISLQSD